MLWERCLAMGSFPLRSRFFWTVRQAAIERRLHDRAGQHVMRCLLERRAKLQHAVGLFARRRFDRKQARAANGQRASLVE
jgi:hypothetical protein